VFKNGQHYNWARDASISFVGVDLFGYFITHKVTAMASLLSEGCLKFNIGGTSRAVFLMVLSLLLFC
jgi:hypothetical protein